MDWRTVVTVFSLVVYANGFSKYGRTCKDIGCLNSEVCVLAEDPCSFGHQSNCGTYPTCKKKSLVEGSHAEPAPSVPKPTPKPQTPVRDIDSPPSYPAPAPPPRDSSFGGGSYNPSPYGGSNPGSPYGGSNPNSPYGGSNPNSPYGGSNPNSPYGGSNPNSPYGGSNPYGGSSSNGGNNPYGGSSFGGGSPYGGNPYGSNGGNSPYGGSRPYNPSPSSGNKGSPLDSILNTLNKYANGGGGSSSTGQGSGSSGLSGIFGNILGNLSKSGGGLNSFLNTRPIMENPNYSSYSSNSKSSNTNPTNYPSGYQPSYNPAPQRNYGQSNAKHSGATTHKPVTYGWNIG